MATPYPYMVLKKEKKYKQTLSARDEGMQIGIFKVLIEKYFHIL